MAVIQQKSTRTSMASGARASRAAVRRSAAATLASDLKAEGRADDGRAVLPQMIAILKRTYPGATCALHHDDPLQLLVATILSAQCTDQRVNLVTRELFKKYKTAADYAAADPATFAQEIRSTGFFQNKAKNILGCCQQLVERHGGQVPADLDALVALPGVGRKTANVVLGTAFGIASGIVVDTHVARLTRRLGLSRQTDPEKNEADLMKLVPHEDWIVFSHLLILHGRHRCTARSPDCDGCELSALCPKILGGS